MGFPVEKPRRSVRRHHEGYTMRRTIRLLLVPLLAACSPTESAQFDAPLQRATPRWATPDRFVGAVAPDERIAIQVHLGLRDEAAAEAALRAISDPQSPRFRQYLSNAELESLHLPTVADVTAVRAHLEANGLRVTYVPDNRAFVSAEGSASTDRAPT
jgi:hypothetical protein